MAAASAMMSGSVVSAPSRATELSSSAALGDRQVSFAPVRNATASRSRVVAVKANYSEDEQPCFAKVVLGSALAAGLAVTLAGSALAASGPGADGAERTARKADELLQAADDFIKNDSPQRFGPERGLGNGVAKEDEDRFSQKAGSGAIPELQDATSTQISGIQASGTQGSVPTQTAQ
ncbi:uncharacterized protein [Physcomitrium patens]|uniref:Uncharacterized protein n=1 Tax=Physcomitrium patens TaxID=3218 RepID=A9RZH1_PHYPA|nr:uncharacterized protein LOC112290548 [Physcomitrium patens]PNR42948.1 hypothetical protein PHYPA_017780 [Physcomitrium patens]|eukprot:XP_024392685.1 uncharacterized protein LOC112290548 [Physcomitrella patens]